MIKDTFLKGILYTCIASIFWGLPQPLFFNELNHVETFEIVLHRGLWSFVFLFLILLTVTKLNEFYDLFRSSKKILVLSITACLIASNWGCFIYAVGQSRVQDASMGYFITPMISIILGNIYLEEKLTKYKITAVLLMLIAIVYLFLSLKEFPILIILIGSTWAVYGLLRKHVKVSPSIGLLYETFIISIFSIPYLLFMFINGESNFISINFKTTIFLILTGGVTIFPLFFFNLGLKYIQLGLAGVLFYLAPSFHFITSYFILNEEILFSKMISFIIIWVGIIFYIYDTFKVRFIENNIQ